LRPQFQKLLQSINSGKRPDIVKLSQWLQEQEPNPEEWSTLTPTIQTAYNLQDMESFHRKVLAEQEPSMIKGQYVDDFSTLIEEYDVGGWLRRYVEHTRGMEPPTAFHFATALSVLAASLRRQVFVEMNYFRIYPAVQILLAGPSGVKKSTAAEYGLDLAYEADETLFHLLPDEGSGEALKKELAENCRKEDESTGMLFISELSTYLGEQQYNRTLVQQMTDLFDSRKNKRRRTNTGGTLAIKNISLTALWCSNDEWLSEAIPVSALGGGLFGRMLLFYQPDSDRSFPIPSLRDPDEKKELQAGIVQSKFVHGVASLDVGALKYYEKRYNEIDKTWPSDERMGPFWERLGNHILKLAMLLSISDNLHEKEKIVIKERHVAQADQILKWVLKYLPAIYVSLGASAFGREYQRVIKMFKQNHGRIAEKELGRLMSSRMSRRKLKEVLDSMVANGVLKKEKGDIWEGTYAWRLI